MKFKSKAGKCLKYRQIHKKEMEPIIKQGKPAGRL
jgi:hypothetical protein